MSVIKRETSNGSDVEFLKDGSFLRKILGKWGITWIDGEKRSEENIYMLPACVHKNHQWKIYYRIFSGECVSGCTKFCRPIFSANIWEEIKNKEKCFFKI